MTTGQRPSVRALLIDDQGRLVLIERRRPGRDPYLVLPGGGVEAGETNHEALRRELMEELGAVVEIGEPLAIDDAAAPIYRCTLVSLDLSLRCGPEFEDMSRGAYIVRRVDPDELRTLTLPIFPESALPYV